MPHAPPIVPPHSYGHASRVLFTTLVRMLLLLVQLQLPLLLLLLLCAPRWINLTSFTACSTLLLRCCRGFLCQVSPWRIEWSPRDI